MLCPNLDAIKWNMVHVNVQFFGQINKDAVSFLKLIIKDNPTAPKAMVPVSTAIGIASIPTAPKTKIHHRITIPCSSCVVYSTLRLIYFIKMGGVG